MAYLYASMNASDDKPEPVRWQITTSRDRNTFGVHTESVYLSFDRETAEAMIRHLEVGISQLLPWDRDAEAFDSHA